MYLNTDDDRQNSFITKKDTNIVKGVALVFMFLHHFFIFPNLYSSVITYPWSESVAYYFCEPLKICVSVFAFLTGYFYYFNNNKTYRYSIRKSTDLWISYLIVLLVLLLPAILLNVYEFSVESFLLEVFVLVKPNMVFCWYVLFYITIMMLLPVLYKALEKCPVLIMGVSFVITSVFSFVTKRFIPEDISYISQIFENSIWVPCVFSGYVFAKYGFFDSISRFLNRAGYLSILIDLMMIVIVVLARRAAAYDFINAPLFIYGLVDLYHRVMFKRLFIPIKIIGKYSMLMWFTHCIFFNVCKDYTQPILYYPKNPALVTLWGIIMCLVASIVLNIPIDFINKQKNKLFGLL